MKTLLLIDDDSFTIRMVEELFRKEWKIVSESVLSELPDRVAKDPPGAVLLNAGLRRTHGDAAFSAIHAALPKVPVIVYCPGNLVRLGRDMVTRGAFWCLTTPLNTSDLVHALEIAMELEDHKQKTQEVHRDFIQLEEGIARMSAPLRRSFPSSFTFEHDELIQGIIDLLCDILQVEIASLMLLDSQAGELRIKAAKGLDSTVIRNTVKKIGQGIAGAVARDGRPLFVRDVDQDPKFAESAFYGQYTTKSLICVPLKVGDQVIGVLSANNKRSFEAFDEHDLYLLTIFSHLFVLTLQNAQLHHDREKTLAKEANLSMLNRKIGESLEPKSLYHALLSECTTMFEADGGLLFLKGEKENELTAYSLSGNRFVETRLSPSVDSYWTESRGKRRAESQDPRGFRILKGILKDEVAGWLWSPIYLKDRMVGSLEIASRFARVFSDSDQAFLDRVAQQAALAINNAHLYEKLLVSLQEIMEARKEVDRIRRKQYL